MAYLTSITGFDDQDVSKFQFPMSLDMSPYLERNTEEGDAIYDLFSVVVHRSANHK